MGVVMAQRAPTASSYVLPALRPLAAMTVSWNQGWFSISVTKRWPTMPVPPITPTLYFFMFKTSICSLIYGIPRIARLRLLYQKNRTRAHGKKPHIKKEISGFTYRLILYYNVRDSRPAPASHKSRQHSTGRVR